MHELSKGVDGFYLTVENSFEYLLVSSYDGELSSSKITLGDLDIEMTTTRSCLDCSDLSSRHVLLKAGTRKTLQFVGLGYRLRSKRKVVSKEEFYDAADQLGEDEADEVAALIDTVPMGRLFATRNLFVLSAWEAETPEIAITVIGRICDELKRPVLALDCSPKQFDDPPRPEAPAADHQKYRAALDASVPYAQRVLLGVEKHISDGLLFAKEMSRDFNEQWLALLKRTRIIP